jgi:hypothetical protein
VAWMTNKTCQNDAKCSRDTRFNYAGKGTGTIAPRWLPMTYREPFASLAIVRLRPCGAVWTRVPALERCFLEK